MNARRSPVQDEQGHARRAGPVPAARSPAEVVNARYLTGEALSSQELAWLRLTAELWGVEELSGEDSLEFLARVQAAMIRPEPRKARRRKPAPNYKQAEAIATAKDVTRARPFPPEIQVINREEGRAVICSPHSDDRGWWVQLHAALGTRSGGVVSVMLAELKRLTRVRGTVDQVDVDRINAALAIINGAEPENELQAMLVAQMVATHWVGMELSARAVEHPSWTQYAALASKLARTYALQAEALMKMQGKTGRQSIQVNYTRTEEKHAHVHHHHEGGGGDFSGQAHAPSMRGVGKSNRSRAPACRDEQCRALPSPDPAWDGVPMPSRPREAEVLPARGSEGLGRTEGQAKRVVPLGRVDRGSHRGAQGRVGPPQGGARDAAGGQGRVTYEARLTPQEAGSD